MNVFCVTISENCRKQPRKILDFVVQTESEQNEVYRHYSGCYMGFCVNVCAANVLNLNIEKPEIKDTAKSKRPVDFLKVNEVQLMDDEKNDIAEFLKKRREASDISSKLRSKIEKRLQSKYSDICYEKVSVSITVLKECPEYINDCTVSANFTFRGSIEEKITNEIAEQNQTNN